MEVGTMARMHESFSYREFETNMLAISKLHDEFPGLGHRNKGIAIQFAQSVFMRDSESGPRMAARISITPQRYFEYVDALLQAIADATKLRVQRNAENIRRRNADLN
jgi:hypothetical protein